MPAQRAMRLCAAAGAAVLAVACGGSDDEAFHELTDGTPLSVEVGSAQAWGEEDLAARPDARLTLQHLAVLTLEPAGTHEGDSGGTGFDRLAYRVDQDTDVTLSIDSVHSERIEGIALRDRRGAVLLRLLNGSPPATLRLAAGVYAIDVRHAASFEAAAGAKTVFVKPGDAGLLGAGGVPAATLRVGQDCVGCSFIDSSQVNRDFSGADLSGAKFGNAKLNGAKFVGATLTVADFSIYSQSRSLAYKTDLTGADFSGAHMQFAIMNAVSSDERTLFVGADLRNTLWNANGIDANINGAWVYPRIDKANFDGAQLQNVDFRGARITHSSFRGAMLMGAKLGSPGPQGGAFLSDGVTSFQGSAFVADAATGLAADLGDADFSGSDFSGIDFTGANLSGAKILNAVFAGAVLRNAKFAPPTAATFGAPFAGANLSGADLSALDLSNADLSVVTLDPGTLPVFGNAPLSDGVAHGIQLAKWVFPDGYTGFKGRDLRYADLTGVSLFEADLGGARLDKARLIGATLSYANLAGASLSGAFAGAAASSGLAAAQFEGAYMPDADLSNADLRSANLAGVHFYSAASNALAVKTMLDGADLTNALLAGATFTGSLTAAVFDGAVLVNANFNGADVTNTKFNNAYLQGADFSNAQVLTGVSLYNASVSTSAGSWSYTERDGTPYAYGYGATLLGAIATLTNVTCPSGQAGGCSGPKLTPATAVYPPVPPKCVPNRKNNFICPPVNTLPSGGQLLINESIHTGDKSVFLLLADNGSLCLRVVGVQKWCTPVSGAAKAVMQEDGNLCLYTAANGFLWCSDTSANTGAFLKVVNSGKAVIYTAGGVQIWAVP